ncbi:MAG: hypothetical protein L7T24_06255 [Luminiphilus sp.]|nr:hypothetical protein [Luminiphilus sp.]
MKKTLTLFLACVLSSIASAGIFDVVKDIAIDVAGDVAADYISDLIINYDTDQTGDEKMVAEKYKQRHGALPQSPLVSSYKTEVLPGSRVSRGSQVTFSSTVELVPGQNKQAVNVLETLTIWDNEDNSIELKSTTKSLTGGTTTGGIFNGQFTMTFPADLPKGTYPVTTAITIDGQQVRSDKTYLDIAAVITSFGDEQIALRSSSI